MTGRHAAPRHVLRSTLSDLGWVVLGDGFALGAALVVLGRLLIVVSSRRAGSARVG
jgi:hypothetical protein